MQFLLTDSDAVEILRSSARRQDGMLLIDIPARHFIESGASQPRLTFSADSRTVNWGTRSARLSKREFDLFDHVHRHGRVSFEDAQDTVWRKPISDSALRSTCSNLSTRLLDAGIPFAVLTRHGKILVEEVAS